MRQSLSGAITSRKPPRSRKARSSTAIALGTLLIVVALVYGAHRLDVHAREILTPAVITTEMDARRTLSPSVRARVAALWEARFGAPPSDRPRLIALTFDDGPYAVSTPLLLDALRELRVPATFFAIGRDAQQFPGLAHRLSANGNEVANHTYSHPNLDALSAAGVRDELQAGDEALAPYTSDPAIAHEMRPPHGRYTTASIKAAQDAGYDVILWNDDPGDWRTVGASAIAAHVEAHATAPEIVLLHSGKLATIAALPQIVRAYRAAGFRFVTVRALLAAAPIAQINRPEHLDLARKAAR